MTSNDEELDRQFAERPGASWRVLARTPDVELKDQGILDELVVDHWLHLEQMSDRVWWMRVGDARVMVEISPSGAPVVDVERGFYRPVNGRTAG